MSRWGKPTKNRKHRDPRYFLNENVELNEKTYNQLAGDELEAFKDRNPIRAPEDVAFDADSFDKDEEKAAEKAAYLSARGDDEAGTRYKPETRNPQVAATMQKLVKQRAILDQKIQQLQDMIDRS
jgi:hypothetical protein